MSDTSNSMKLALKYAGATGTLLGGINFIIGYDSMTADEIRKDLKKLYDKIEAELEEIED